MYFSKALAIAAYHIAKAVPKCELVQNQHVTSVGYVFGENRGYDIVCQ